MKICIKLFTQELNKYKFAAQGREEEKQQKRLDEEIGAREENRATAQAMQARIVHLEEQLRIERERPVPNDGVCSARVCVGGGVDDVTASD
eukprot:COSAG01_NODE_9253_length_2502_cov_3.151061_1_plen_90_part_10